MNSRRCPHADVKDCPLYWAIHNSAGGSCWPKDNDLQTGCAVEKGASYDGIYIRSLAPPPAGKDKP